MKSTVETKIIELVKLGHDLAKELHCAESAALVSDLASQLEVQLVRSNALAAENAELREACGGDGNYRDCPACAHSEYIEAPETPSTEAFLAEVRASARREGAHFVANRMLAAWDAGFIEDTAKNAADIARMILTSTEFMADAPEGDFERSFADGVLKDIAAQLRKGAAQ